MRALLCVSDFPYTEPTVRFGSMVAHTLNAQLTLLSVGSSDETTKKGEELLERAASLADARSVEHKIRRGRPETEIMAELDDGNYDLLIVGARDHPGPRELLLGFVAHRLVKHAKVSVLVVRKPIVQSIRHILVCTSGPDAGKNTVRTGAHLADTSGAIATLLYVASGVPSMYAGLSRFGEGLADLLQTDTPIARHLRSCAELIQTSDIDARVELRHGLPAEEILRSAEVDETDLIVVGGSSRRGLKAMLWDEVSMQIVTNATRPVLVVRGVFDH